MSTYDNIPSSSDSMDMDTEGSGDSFESFTDKSALIPKFVGRTYGTGKNKGETSIAVDQRLTYTWKEIDVYGQIPGNDTSAISKLWKRVKSCCTGNGRETIPRKQLLKNITGVAHSGELLAVLGSSGAGKTSLLNALAFRSPVGIKVSSTSVRALNGIPVTAKQLRSNCAYVQQDDLFIGSLTAKEHLIFQAMLRMSRHISFKDKMMRVNHVISELSLRKCANTTIGSPGQVKGLSGGERKRLAFASEALTDPHLLLCDEPTSGLDSFMAHSVLVVLKKLAMKGKTIIITIHQPSSELFGMFDKILLIAEGRTAFMGTPEQATEFFDQLQLPCPNNYNPADYFVQLLAIAPNREQECRNNIKKICDTFAISPMAEEINEIASNLGSNEDIANLKKLNGYKYRATWFTQFHAILWRSWLSVLKEPMLVKVRLLQTTMVAILIGTIFFGQVLDQDGVMNINGSIFLFLTNMTFQNVFAVINVFSTEIPIFIRESRGRLYRTDTYFLGKTLAELPLFLAVPIIFTAIAYPMIGLRAGWSFFLTACCIVSLVANVSTSFGYLISCASSSISMALSIGPPVIIPFLIFGGFFLNAASVPAYFEWLSYLSWFRYGNEALLINQWTGVTGITCSRSNATCPTSGRIVLETFNFSPANFYWDIMALIALIILFRLAAYTALYIRSRSKE